MTSPNSTSDYICARIAALWPRSDWNTDQWAAFRSVLGRVYATHEQIDACIGNQFVNSRYLSPNIKDMTDALRRLNPNNNPGVPQRKTKTDPQSEQAEADSFRAHADAVWNNMADAERQEVWGEFRRRNPAFPTVKTPDISRFCRCAVVAWMRENA